MAQYIKNANIFGRIGTGIGKGLAEQVPKEIENYRLKSGLKEIADESDQGNLSPAQFLAKTAGTYGVTPQMIQSFGELAKIQNQGNAYKKSAGGNPRPGQQSNGMQPNASANGQGINDVRFANQHGQNMPPQGQVNNQQQSPNQSSNENVPQVAPGNALNQENLTRLPWTPQQRDQTISDYIDQGFLPEQAKQLQADDENRDLAEPGAHKERLQEIKNAKDEVSKALTRHLEKKLQKTGEGLYEDIEGSMLLNAEKGMQRDLILNPKADIDNVANDWSERLRQTALAKGEVKNLGKTSGIENLLKGNSPEKKLKEYQNIFKNSGNLEEYQKILEGPDFGMSPQAAAYVAYPLNNKIKGYVDKVKISPNPIQNDQKARKAALEIGKDIGPDDSVLAIARSLSQKDPFFDQQAFFDQISEDKDQLGLNARQRRELGKGTPNSLPNWADLLYLPIRR